MFGRKKSAPKENYRNDFRRGKGEEDAPVPNREEVKQVIFLKNENARKILGFVMIALSVFLLISFISFFKAWQADQSLIEGNSWSIFKINNPDAVKNAMGYLGAWSGYQFIHKGFGLGVFFWLLLPLSWGVYLVSGFRMVSMLKLFTHVFFLSLWCSIALGFLFGDSYSMLGGAVGYNGYQWMRGMAGNFGVVLFLALYALIYLMLGMGYVFFRKPDTADDLPPFVSESATVSQPEAETVAAPEPENRTYEPVMPDNPAVAGIHLKELEPEETDEPAPFEPEPAPVQHEPMITEDEPRQEIEFGLPETAPVRNPVITDTDLEVVQAPEEEEVTESEAPRRPEHFGIGTEYDPTLELSGFMLPGVDLLNEYEEKRREIDTAELEESKNMIVETLKNYNIGIAKIKASIGPTVTLYEIIPAPGVKISRIKNLEDDIALSLAALGIRIIAPIPGKGTVGIEVPNKHPEMVPMRSCVASRKFQESEFELPVILGKTISNELYITDLTRMPHLLMAGATGQGKSVGLNAILVSILYRKHPSFVKFVLVDPKKVELTLYNRIERHYLAKLPGDGDAIITDNTKVIHTLNSLCVEMDNRYKLLQDAQVRNIVEYNRKFGERKLNPNNGHRHLPYIVVVVDEVADLMMTAGKEIETPIARLAQLARAIGIHLILATQRPSVNVITGMIKANFPARIAFRVTSKIDSRTILDANGADQLIGKGDMLFSGGNDMIRLQCPFVDTPEVERITQYIGEQRGYSSAYILPEVKEDGVGGSEEFNINERDSLFEDAARIVVQNQVGSTSLIQRRLKIGYNRAGRLIDQLEACGIVGPFEGSKARSVLIPDEYSLEQFLKNLNDAS